MKTTAKNDTNDKIENLQNKNFKFYWIFDGNGDYAQKHDEIDHRRFVNYENKSNQDL